MQVEGDVNVNVNVNVNVEVEVETSRKARDELANHLPSKAGRPEVMPCLGRLAISTSRGGEEQVLWSRPKQIINRTVMGSGT